jgi:heat shock protein HslJ
MRFSLTRATGVALLTLLVSACSAVSAGQSQQPDLDGTAWVLSSLPGRTPLAGTAVTLQFAGARVSGSDGCNRFSGGYTPGKTGLQVGQLASTQMACPPDVMEQARAVTSALAESRSYRVAGDTLELLGEDGKARATFTAQSTQLAGTQWTATGINNGRAAVAGLVAGTSVTLEFGADGRASGSAGCNRYTTSYEAARDTLKFGAAATTRMMCAVPGVMEQEQAFLNALATVTTARMEGDRLELRTADGALAASFRRAGSD